MKISVVMEIKPAERRVALTHASSAVLLAEGHEVSSWSPVPASARACRTSSTPTAGATIVSTDTAWRQAELLVKVKEPIAAEYSYLRPDPGMARETSWSSRRLTSSMRLSTTLKPVRMEATSCCLTFAVAENSFADNRRGAAMTQRRWP
jgi:alanine dehydrogenase